MLSIKENLQETLKKDGHPDRFVKQYEFLHVLMPSPYYMGDYPFIPGNRGYDQYGVLWEFHEGQMGPMPRNSGDFRVLKDITKWRECVHRPVIPDDPEYWGMLNGIASEGRAAGKYVCALHTQGLFERLHDLMGMEDSMINFYAEPEELKALIDFITGIELDYAKAMVGNVGINAVLHHDDWGGADSTFMSKDMFDEFLLPAYKKIYGYYKENGVLIVHHNDGFGATLVPSMIEMGIDIWQGVLPVNDIPALLDRYEGQITFMGEIETRYIDLPDWTEEKIAVEVEQAVAKVGNRRSFIPCLTAGLGVSQFPGVYDAVDTQIDKMSAKLFS